MDNQIINVESLRSLASGERFACLFSGGKDCAMAFALAKRHGIPLALIHCINNDISTNHNQKTSLIREQAAAMDLPLYTVSCDMRSNEYIYQLTKLLKRLYSKGIQSLVTGTQYDYYAYKVYSAVTKEVSMSLRMPLWGLSDRTLLTILEENQIHSIITTINDPRIPSTWLGKKYDDFAYTTFLDIGIHPFGEYNEFHTTLVDANFFTEKMQIVAKEVTNDTLKVALIRP